MIMGVAYGVDRWQDICRPFSAGGLQWRVKESWNGAELRLTLTGEWAMIKTIKPNLASNPLLHQQPHSPCSFDYPGSKHTEKQPFNPHLYWNLIFPKADRKSCRSDEIILAAPAPTSLVLRVFLALWWYQWKYGGSFDLFQDNVTWLKKTLSWSALDCQEMSVKWDTF